ncbi:protein AHNAK2-like isoform X2 [Polypterus senegalus]|uniref:protein AHNAK2-like isoform X2 n=1 Tax=Polypterus senegalus TaxID=55291 RepID=UPI001965EC1E|nr:protein AHNAK2-like isoform X2 [Polypterus senegalus]
MAYSSRTSRKSHQLRRFEILKKKEENKNIIFQDDVDITTERGRARKHRQQDNRISWPKFPSLTKGKKMQFRRSQSTPETDEHKQTETSPTNSDAESSCQSDEPLQSKKMKEKNRLSIQGTRTLKNKVEEELSMESTVKPSEHLKTESRSSKKYLSKQRSLNAMDGIKSGKSEIYSQDTNERQLATRVKKEYAFSNVIGPEVEISQSKEKPLNLDNSLQIQDSSISIQTMEAENTFVKCEPQERRTSRLRSELRVTIKSTDREDEHFEEETSPKFIIVESMPNVLGQTLKYDVWSTQDGTLGSEDAFQKDAEVPHIVSCVDVKSRQLDVEINTQKSDMFTSRLKFDIIQPNSDIKDEKIGDYTNIDAINRDKGKNEQNRTITQQGDIATISYIQKTHIAGEEEMIKMHDTLTDPRNMPKLKMKEKKQSEDTLLHETTICTTSHIQRGGMKEMKDSLEVEKTSLLPTKEKIVFSKAREETQRGALPEIGQFRTPEEKTLKFDISEKDFESKGPKQIQLGKPEPTTYLKTEASEICCERTDTECLKAKETLNEAGGDVQTLSMDDRENKKKKGKFKIPHFKMPSFEINESTEKLPADAEDTSTKKVDIKQLKTDMEKKDPEIQKTESEKDFTLSKPKNIVMVSEHSAEVKEPMEPLDEKSSVRKFKLPKSSDIDIQGPKMKGKDIKRNIHDQTTETKFSKAKTEVKIPHVQAQTLSLENEEKSKENGKFKMQEIHMPQFGISISKGSSKEGKGFESTSKIDITSPKVELDVRKQHISKEGKAEVNVTVPTFSISTTKPSGNLVTGEPSIKLTKPEGDIKVDKEQVLEAEMPDVDVSIPTTKEKQISMTLKETGITLTEPKLKHGAIQGGTEETIMEDKEKDGKQIKFKIPQVKMSTFGVSVSAEKVPKEEIHVGEIKPEVSLPAVAVDIKGPQVTTVTTGLDVSGGRPEIDLASQNISVTAPQTDVQLPSIMTHLQIREVQLMEPGQPELVETVPGMKNFDVTVPVVETDIHLPKIEKTKKEIREETEASSKKDTKKEKKKGKFKMPSFGSSASPEKLPKDAVDAGTAKVDITLPKADLEIKGPEVQVSDQEDSTLSKPKQVLSVTMPSVEVEERDVDIKLPGETLEEKGKESKFKLPKIPDFDIAFSKIKGTDVKSAANGPGTETKLSEAEIKVKGLDGESEILSSEDAKMKMEKGKFKMPEIHMPKFGISFSKGSSKQSKGDEATSKTDITSPKVELDVKKPHISTEGKAEVNLTTPEISISKTKPSVDLVTGELGIKVPRPEGDIKVDREQVLEAKIPDIDVSLPTTKEKQTAMTLKETDINLTNPKLKAGAIKGDNEQAVQEQKETDGKEIKFKMPNVKWQTFGVSVSEEKVPKQEMHVGVIKPEVSIPAVAVDVKEIQVTTVTTGLDVSRGRPGIDLAKQTICVAAPQIDAQPPSITTRLQTRQVQLKEPVQPELGEYIPGTKSFAVTVHGVETDINLEKIEKTKKETREEIEASSKEDIEKEKKKGKFKMPHFKMPSFGSSASPEKLPKDAVDAGSAKVDITLPKADLEIKGPKVQVSEDQEASMLSKPEQVLTVTMPSVEVEERDVDIKLPGETLEEKGKESKFKLPKIPDFDIAFPNIKSSDVKSAVQESDTETKLPAAEIEVKGLDGESEILSSEDAELKMEKGKFKMPEIHMSKFSISFSKSSSKQGKGDESTTKIDITSPKVELDIKKPQILTESKAKVKVTAPEISISTTKPSGDLVTGELGINVTRLEGDIKVDREQVLDGEMPDVNVSLSTTKEKQIAMTLKETDITLTKPKVKPAAIQGDTEQEIVEDKEKDGKQIKFKMPQVKMPMFEVSVSAEKVPKEEIHVGEIKPEVSLPAVAVDFKGPQVTTVTTGLDVSGGRPEIDLASQNISVTAPQIDVQLPSITTRLQSKEVQLKEPEQPELVESVPGMKNFDVTVPGVETDIHLLKIEKTKKETREEIEASSKEDTEKEKKKGKFKMPHFKMPSFGSSASPEKLPKDAVDAGSAKVDIKLPKADLEIKGPKVQVSEDQEASMLSKPEQVLTVTMPSVEVEERDVDIKLPGETLEEKGKESKFKLPKIPDFDIAFPKIKSSDVKSAVQESGTEIKLPAAEIEVKGLDGESEILSSEDAELKMEKGKFKIPELHMPKFGISFSKGSTKQGKGDESTTKIDITSSKVELDIKKPQILTESKAEVKVTTPELSISTTKPSGDLVTGELGIKVPRPEGDIKVDREQILEAKMPDVDVSLPNTEEKQIAMTLKEADTTITKPKLKPGAIQGDTEQAILEEKETDGKEIKFKMPNVKWQTFGVSVSEEKVPKQEMHVGVIKPEVSVPAVAVDVEGPKVTTVTNGLDVSGARPDIDLATQNISVAAPQIDVQLPSKTTHLQTRQVQLKEPVQPELGEYIPGMKSFDVTVHGVETDIHLPKIEKTKKETRQEIEASSKEDTEKEKKKGKFKMPHFKMPSFGSSASPEKLPKDAVDAGSVKVDIKLPKADLEIKGPKVQVSEVQEASMLSKPEQVLTVTMPSVEVEERDVDIKLPGETLEEKGKESKFKLPKIPDFDIAFPKIKGPDVKWAANEPCTETKLPEAEIEVKGLDGESEILSSEDAELKMEKGKFKIPELHMPKFGISFSKGSTKQGKGDESTTKIDITSSKVELDIKKPQILTESKAEVKVTTPELSISTTKPSGDLVTGELGIKVPRPEGDIKVDREQILEAEMPDVDISLPTTEEKQIAMTLKEADTTITKPKLKPAAMQVDTEREIVEDKEKDGKQIKFKMPQVKMPKFEVSVSAEKVPKEEIHVGEIKPEVSLPVVAVDFKGPQVTTVTTGLDVSGARPEIDLASQNISVTAPQIDVQLPSITTRLQSKEVQLKEPEQPELVEYVPGMKNFDVTVPGVETDIHLPKIEKTKRETGEEIEASSKEDTEKEKKKEKFKMPHFKMPSFGSSASPEKLPKDAVEAGSAKVDITLPKADLEMKGPKVQVSEDQKVSMLSKPEQVLTVTMPSVEVEERDVDIKLPGETLEEKGKESKFKLPKFLDFDIAFPKIKSSDVKSAVHEPGTEIKLPEAEIEVKGLDGEPEILSSEDAELKMEKGRFKMSQIHMPKFGISFSKGSSKQDKGDESTSKIDITSPKVELDVEKPQISTEGKAEVKVTAHEFSISTKKPSADLVTGELGIKVPRPKGDIKVDREQILEAEMPDVDISLPTTEEKQIAMTLKEADTTITKPKLKPAAMQVDTEREIVEDKDKDGKQIKFKMPQVKMPKFEVSVSAEKVPKEEIHVGEIKPEVSLPVVAVDFKGPQVTTVTTGLDVSGARPEIDLASQNISVTAPQIHVQLPSITTRLQSKEVQLKEPEQPELVEYVPGMKNFDVTVPGVETDIHLPKIEKTKRETGEQIEASSKEDTEKEKKKEKFKMPHFKMPSFGSSASPEKLPKDAVEAGSAK